MRVRIPGWVHPVWDRVERRPWVAASAATTVAAAGFAAWRPMLAPIVILALASVAAGAAYRVAELNELRAENGRLHHENALLSARLRHYDKGAASASTQRLHTIGDLGERL